MNVSILKTRGPTAIDLRTYLHDAVAQTVDGAYPGYVSQVRIRIAKPRHRSHGDLSTNVAHQLSRLCGDSASHIAHELLRLFPWHDDYVCAAGSSVSDGFINFRASNNCLARTIARIDAGSFAADETANRGALSSAIDLIRKIINNAECEIDAAESVAILTSPFERELLCLLAEIPGLQSEPISIPDKAVRFFARRIVDAFQQFYRSCPIYNIDRRLTNARLKLARTTAKALSMLARRT